MVTISDQQSCFTVMVRIVVDPELQQELVEDSKRMMEVFATQPGFVSMSLHRSHAGTEVLTYLHWESEADHEACRASPEVAAAGGAKIMEYFQDGRATMEVTTYDVVATRSS